MHLTTSLVLFIFSFSAFVTSAPFSSPSHQLQGRSFKVVRSLNPAFTGHNGPKQLLKAYRKFGVFIPSGLQEASDQQSTTEQQHHAASQQSTSKAQPFLVSDVNDTGIGEVIATPEANDVEYLSPVNIGGQTLNMDFDTGSSDLWVFNTALPEQDTFGHTLFDPEKSSTFQTLRGASFKISYGDGSEAVGIVGTDTVNIGGATVTSQAVELATSVSGGFIQDIQSNGLLGLAFSSLNTVKPQQQKTFFDNALDTLAEPLFTADLRASDVGAYEFGVIDETKFEGSLSWANIDSSAGFWQFNSERFQVGTGQMMTMQGGQAIADTGTTLLLINPVVVNAYYGQVDGAINNATAGGITFPCDADLPDLSIDIGGTYMATIPGSLINFSRTSGNTCFGAVQEAPNGLQIYGDVLFKAQFVVFNAGNTSIGMAPHA